MPSPESQTDLRKHHRRTVDSSEATGLLLIALVLTLVGYWHNIRWSLR